MRKDMRLRDEMICKMSSFCRSMYAARSLLIQMKLKIVNRIGDEDLENGANIEKQNVVGFSEVYVRSKKGDDKGESFAAGS